MMILQELEYVATIFDKGWKDFGIEGSATKHKQLSEQFLTWFYNIQFCVLHCFTKSFTLHY